MGRTQPTIVTRPNQNRRDERARRARDTKNRVIPDLLRGCPRTKHGIAKAELIVDPAAVHESSPNTPDPLPRSHLTIRLQALDTLTAASRISEKSYEAKRSTKSRPQRPNVAVLNMASALRPGGGFLEGANSQEEFLCARTTVYPSLWDSFYRMPDVSGIFTPDVLVFRDNLPEANDLSKNDRYFIDVISSSMFRFSDARAEGCSCGVSYCDRHRDVVIRKMRAVMRIAQSKGAEKIVLGAWGCGAHGNPVREVAKYWRKVIAGAPRQRRPNVERWDGIKEIIFAIPDRTMLREFELAFQDVLSVDPPSPASEGPIDSPQEMSQEHARTSELLSRIAEIEMQLEQTTNTRLKNRLRETLASLQRDLQQGPKAKASNAEDVEEDEVVDDFSVVPSFPAGSDGEFDTSFYNLDEHDLDSDSDNTRSDIYEFRPGAPPGFDSQTSHDEEDESQDDSLHPVLSNSAQFDPETGWYTGSMDGLTALLAERNGLRSCSRQSSGSPGLVRPDSMGELGIDAEALHGYLRRYEGSDVHDY